MNPRAFNSAHFNLTVHTPQARQMLLFSRTTSVPWSLSSPRAGNGLTGIDETSVNSSLISFLQAITGIDPAPSHEWRSSKIRLHANFGIVGNAAKPRQYVAITDGLFILGE
jgi:hypothetical protein